MNREALSRLTAPAAPRTGGVMKSGDEADPFIPVLA